MSHRSGPFPYWWTEVEISHDPRTDARAEIRCNGSSDDWNWIVNAPFGSGKAGSSKSQKGARAACRRLVKKLPSLKAT